MAAFIHLPEMQFNRSEEDNENGVDMTNHKPQTVTSVDHLPAWKQADFYSDITSYPDGGALRVRQYPPPPQMQPNVPASIPSYQSHHPQQQYAQEMFFQPMMEPRRPVRKRRRPPHSYASMIAQAILTSPSQKMTLRDIYEWVQTRYPHLYEANETGWQNTIRHNLSLNRCFIKLPRSPQDSGKGKGKGGYWGVDVEQLGNTTFGRQLLDSGVPGGFEYWRSQQPLPTQLQQQQQQQHQPQPQQAPPAFDFDYHSQPQNQSFYTTEPVMRSSNSSLFSHLRRPFAPPDSTSSSGRDSMSPGTPAATPILSPANLATLQHQQQHHQIVNSKMHPSSMRLNNILN